MKKIEKLTIQVARLDDRIEYLRRTMDVYPERFGELNKMMTRALKDRHVLADQLKVEKNLAWVEETE